MSLITVTTLGPVSVQGTLGPELPARGKLIALLVYLARRSNGGVRREELAALFWGDKPEALARQSLRHGLMRLRRAIGDQALIVSADDVRVAPGSITLDVTRFEQRLAAGDLAAAVTLWNGDFLNGFEDAGGEAWHVWLEAEREGLRQRLGYALATLVEQAEARGDWELASRLAEQWCTASPLDERAPLRWIHALRLSGRNMDALAAHARVMGRLRVDFGLEPSVALVRMGEELAHAAPTAAARSTSGSNALFTPDLIGRTAAFAALVAAWRTTQAQPGVVVLLEGEEGFGKTRLLDEFLRWQRAQPPAALVLRARAFEADRDVPWSTARELLSDLRTAPGLSGAPDSALAELAELVPSLAARFRNLPQATGSDDARARALTQVLGDVATELPVLLVIDDFTTADAASARLALAIARRPPAGVLVVLAIRTDCIQAAAYEDELRNASACRRVRLEPLTLADVEAVIASMLEMNPDMRHTLAERIYSETAGNPLYSVELIAALADEGSLFIGASGLWEVDEVFAHRPLPVPENVRSVARMRTERLGAAPRRVLEAAALLGAHAAIDSIAAVTGMHGDELDSAIAELVVRKLVRPPNGSASIDFTHEIVRRSVCDAISPARRQRYERVLARLSRPARRWRSMTVAAALVASITLFAFWRSSPVDLPLLAVGEIVDQSGTDSAAARFPMRDLLATRLATLPSLPVISPERMHELRAQLASLPVAVRTMQAARRAGAQEIVQGTLLQGRNGQLRLELRRVNTSTGAVAGAYSVTGADALALVDAATEAIASGFGIRVQPGQPGMPASLVAYRLYEEGMRTYYQGDGAAAHRFFTAALEEDSTFALAAFYDYAAQQMAGLLNAQSDTQLARVVRHAAHAPPRESLLIRALWAAHVHAPGRLALAETLAIRYPHEPEGHLMLGHAKYAAGDQLGAIPHYLKVVSMDTLGVRDAPLPCRACDALAGMTSAYSLADSLPAAERSARAWARLQPSAARAWAYLATVLEYQGRFDEAVSVRRNALALRPGDRVDLVYPARVQLRQGNYRNADPMLRQRMSVGPAALAREASWYLIISLREQGRLREALEVAREYNDSLSQAMIRLEMGHARVAAEFFEAQAAHLLADTVVPRHGARIWRLAHAATARALAGDTGVLSSIADTIAALGAHTTAARNIKLRHYPLGLLYAARGDHQAAVRTFERSVNSLTNGYGRLNLELARSLIAINQPRRAVAVLEAGLRGPVDAGNYYVTHTDFRELLGAAYESAALPDSALIMYRRVLSAWNNADASLDMRRARLQHRVDALTRQNPRSAALARRP